MRRTTRSTTYDDAPHTFVNASEATGFREALGRLQPGFDRVNWEEEEVHGGTGQTACLTANAYPVLTDAKKKKMKRGTRTTSDCKKVGAMAEDQRMTDDGKMWWACW